MDSDLMKVKKTWFIRSKAEKIEDLYKFDAKSKENVWLLTTSWTYLTHGRNWARVPMVMLLRAILKTATCLVQLRSFQRAKLRAQSDSN